MNGSSLWIEDKYVNLLSSQLSRFSKKDSHTYNFRCPFCGDSQKNKHKSRGYFFQNKGRMFYKCHNCGIGKSFDGFIKDIDPNLYKEYKFEVLKESNYSSLRRRERPPVKEEKSSEEAKDLLTGLKKADYFKEGHPIHTYLQSRKIPPHVVDDLYYSDRFMEWVNTVIPEKFDRNQLKRDEPRLVIPFVGANGEVFAVTGRSFKKNSIKYITIKFDEDQNKIFGMDKVDPSRRVYVVEGPIDSFFLDNSIAFAGSSGTIPEFDDFVIVLDNEPRNKDIVRLMERFIEKGYKVCIWPDETEEKDINEMIMNGRTPDDVRNTIDMNTFSGLAARVRMSAYKKL